jgi:hypothetical protein
VTLVVSRSLRMLFASYRLEVQPGGVELVIPGRGWRKGSVWCLRHFDIRQRYKLLAAVKIAITQVALGQRPVKELCDLEPDFVFANAYGHSRLGLESRQSLFRLAGRWDGSRIPSNNSKQERQSGLPSPTPVSSLCWKDATKIAKP